MLFRQNMDPQFVSMLNGELIRVVVCRAMLASQIPSLSILIVCSTALSLLNGPDRPVDGKLLTRRDSSTACISPSESMARGDNEQDAEDQD